MASGSPVATTRSDVDLPYGSALTYSGRISAVKEPDVPGQLYPISIKERVALDEALKWGSRASKARFAVYIGDLGANTAAAANQILGDVPTPNDAVLLAVSPNQRAIEVVYGAGVRGRGGEAAATLGVAAAKAGFAEGNLIDGLVSAIRVMSASISRP
ncbi:DUF5130 family protein [Mycolicibacterium brumae]|uniref:DUF5130 family protein n=1 Tax=Mycolicibacterium brumae TaxID=85968 RepID=UPI000B16774F|nr:DUF5130 family protein [Mycolicibacterium brumae]RWA16161.1 hypothetical protein MBRU_08615 [Mycolicibacterium brumae DSM 44177]UWW09443.1 DUF5130 domain-containing protein [Mycolicibacterium brumae]